MENDELVQNMLLELRRGVISIAVLSRLSKEEYGYSLLKALSDQGLEVDQSTLYPLLRRLEFTGTVTVRLAYYGRSPSAPLLRHQRAGQGCAEQT